jgi:Na+-transporting methylmalonyl-CoA/oxaloacetate decarboxylase gamma subunit
MAEQPTDIAGIIRSIQADVTTIVKGEIELAKAELLPQAKAAGVGAGMFGAAAYVGITGVTILFIGLSFLLSLGFSAWFGLSLLAALAWGFSVMALLLFVVAGILALLGRKQLVFNAPEATIAQAQASADSVKAAVEQGKQAVANLSLTGGPTTPELPAATTAR